MNLHETAIHLRAAVPVPAAQPWPERNARRMVVAAPFALDPFLQSPHHPAADAARNALTETRPL